MHLSVLAEILDSLRSKNMLQDLSPMKREEIVIFICEQYSDYVEDEYRDEYRMLYLGCPFHSGINIVTHKVLWIVY